MTFRRIRELRISNDYKQMTVAKYLNVKQSTYSDYENGKINIPIETFIKLASFYRVSIDYLVERTDQPDGNSIDEKPVLPLKKK